MAISIDFDAPWDIQIAQARAQGVLLSEIYYQLADEMRAYAQTISNLAQLDQVQRVIDQLAAVQAEGQTLADFKKWAKTQDWTLPKGRLETIYRNSAQTAYQAGHWRDFEENKAIRPYLMYDAINDSRTRPSHLAMDGIIKPVDDSFWNTHSAPMGHRCLLPGMRIKGDFRLGSKAAYSGPAVEIETATGKRLSVTVNHPILTSNGWVPAGELKEGERLLCDSSSVDWIPTWGINDEQFPPTVEDIFESLGQQAFGRTSRLSFDLHGDAKFGKGDIDVAGANCVLMHGFKPHDAHCIKYREFVFADCSSASGGALNPSGNAGPISVGAKLAYQSFGVGSGFPCRVGYFNQAKPSNLVKVLYFGLLHVINRISSLPSCTALAFNSRSVVFHGRPFDGLSLAGSPWGDAITQKKAAYCTPAYAESIRQGIFTFSADIIRNQLRRIIGFPLPRYTRLSCPDGAGLLARAALHPSIAQQTAKEAITDVRLFENLHSGYPGHVAGDEIVSIRNFTFSGHVYDFQTDQGWMFAQGLIISNCRCTLRSLSQRDAMAKGGVTHSVPADAKPDKGWGYKPTEWGKTLDGLKAEKMTKLPPGLFRKPD